MYLDQWAKENLSPEYQEKFFAGQAKIEEDCKQIDRWLLRTEEAMNLSQEQIDFVRKHNIVISTAYFGMVRLYKDNKTIFQTSAMASIMGALCDHDEGMKIDYDNLSLQVREYLNLVMSASPEEQDKLLQNNMPLFGFGELDKIGEICGSVKNPHW